MTNFSALDALINAQASDNDFSRLCVVLPGTKETLELTVDDLRRYLWLVHDPVDAVGDSLLARRSLNTYLTSLFKTVDMLGDALLKTLNNGTPILHAVFRFTGKVFSVELPGTDLRIAIDVPHTTQRMTLLKCLACLDARLESLRGYTLGDLVLDYNIDKLTFNLVIPTEGGQNVSCTDSELH
ncbi:hypothetical protein ACLPJK_26680 [Pseudomonas aeruginosa]|uniref:hypothetical protein n=1 Tax=Pseudomonas aeruginosa TaxID=287 RepID=UPI003D2BF463